MTKACPIGAVLTLLALVGTSARAEDPTPRFGFIGLHGGVFEQLKLLEKTLSVRLDYLNDDAVSRREVDLSQYTAVFVQHARPEDKDAYCDMIVAARQKNPRLKVLSLSGGSALDIFKVGSVALAEQDAELSKYYGASKENLRRLIVYALVKYAGRDLKIEPAEERVTFGLWHPEHEGFFETADSFLRWSRDKGRASDSQPRVAIAVHRIHLELQQPRVVQALIHALEKEGVLAVAIVDTAEGLGGLREKYEQLLLDFKPAAVIHTCHSPDVEAFRQKLGVPHLHSVFFTRDSIGQWCASPDGLDPGMRAFQVASQELVGAIEPQVGAGTRLGGNGEAFMPIEDRVEHLVRRTIAWVRLGRKPNREKRVAVVYYDCEMGKGELMRGTATGMFLNGPRSCVKVLGRLSRAGYTVSPIPQDEKELVAWMMDRGRQIGVWAAGELDRVVQHGDPVLVPVAKYVSWLEKRVPEAQRKELIEKWGPPPGRFLVWENARHEKFIVIPRIQLGNVVLLPQPLRGEAQDPKALLHDHHVPPPHNYLATYFWLEEELHADALIHFGTHGSEIALPGKSAGLSNADWSDICLGSMPNVNPWIVNNLGETSPAKRRAYAVLVSHLTPPLVNAELSDELLNVQSDIDKWTTLDAGALKEKFRASITRQVRERKLEQDLHLDLAGDRLLSIEEIGKLEEYLHDVHNEKMPVGLHVLGEPPPNEALVPWLVSCLGKKFLSELAAVYPVPETQDVSQGARSQYLRKKAEEIVGLLVRQGLSPLEAVRAASGRAPVGLPEVVERGLELAVDLKERFGRTHEEVDNILAALDGKFVPPGPGNSPERNPGSVPTGRNLYLLNPEEVPSRPSWEIARALVDQMLDAHRRKHGHFPEKVAFDLSSFATFQDYGVMEAQILYLLGVEPIWNERNLVEDVRVIPRDVLKRPRIDVFISALSYYRDSLPSRMALLDKAIRRVAEIEEEDNGVRLHSLAIEGKLRGRGVPTAKASTLARARVFGYPRGQYGSSAYYYLVERSGTWETREELVDAYLSQVSNVYSQGMWGEPAREAYEESIQGTDVVLRSWSDSTTSPLSSKYTWYMGGSLALAVKHLTGKEPEFLLSDVRDPDQGRMVSSEDAIRQELRVRLFNRKWIEALRNEGYAGADQVAKMVSNTLGWKVMRDGSVSDDVWDEIKAIYVDDKLHMNVREWFESENPYAFQDMTEVLLEAARKGYWKADAATVRQLSELYAASVVRHGEGGGLRGGGNVKLEAFVERALTEAPGAPNEALIAAYRQRAREAAKVQPTGPSAREGVKSADTKQEHVAEMPPVASERMQVRGQKLEEIKPDGERAALCVMLGLAVALAAYGFVRRRGAL